MTIYTSDLLLQIVDRDNFPHSLWITKVAFSQPNEEAVDKMQADGCLVKYLLR